MILETSPSPEKTRKIAKKGGVPLFEENRPSEAATRKTNEKEQRERERRRRRGGWWISEGASRDNWKETPEGAAGGGGGGRGGGREVEQFRWCINRSRRNEYYPGGGPGRSQTLNQILIKRNCGMIFHGQLRLPVQGSALGRDTGYKNRSGASARRN